MGISKASAEWTGGFKSGTGAMRPAHGAESLFSTSTRFEGKQGSNPEELLGAALSGCFSMALTLALEMANAKPQSVKTTAEVHLDKQGAGFAVTTIDLVTDVTVDGIDDAKFQEVAAETKKGCPVSKALGAVTINLTARRSGG